MAFSNFKHHQILISLLLICIAVKSELIDRTLEVGANGEGVVDAVIDKIGKNFGEDFGFFKNLAWVTTEFGNKSATGDCHGGIWQVSEAKFKVTKTHKDNGMYKRIYREFGYKWRHNVIYEQLNKPLISALALHLYVYITDHSIRKNGFPQTLAEQEAYCVTNLSLNIPTGNFQQQVEKFEESRRSCSAKVDFVIVLDGSGSVGQVDFKKSLQFVSRTFELYNTKVARLGFIVYSDTANPVISLNDKMTPQRIRNKVIKSSYPSSWTATGDGITAALNLFRHAKNRKGVPRILAVFTDGHSNYGTTSLTSVMTQASSMDLTSYAIGIGNYTLHSELLEIALNDSTRIVEIKNYDNLKTLFRSIHTKICLEPQNPSLGYVTKDELESNQTRLYLVPEKRKNRRIPVYVKVNVTKGKVICLLGRHTTVNRDYNDGEISDCEGPIPPQGGDSNQRQRRSDGDLRHAYTEGDEEIDIPDDFYDPVTVEPDLEIYYVAVIGSDPINEYSISFT